MRVLIVDDDRDTVVVQSLILNRFGYETRTCTSGSDALRMLEEFRPGAMLLDLAMPDVSGFDVADQLQERPELRPSLLIALTGLGDKRTRLATERAGFNFHLLKPVKLAQLMAILRLAEPAPAADAG